MSVKSGDKIEHTISGNKVNSYVVKVYANGDIVNNYDEIVKANDYSIVESCIELKPGQIVEDINGEKYEIESGDVLFESYK